MAGSFECYKETLGPKEGEWAEIFDQVPVPWNYFINLLRLVDFEQQR